MVTPESGYSIPARKKVLILTPFYSPNIGGAETYTEALVNEAVKKHDIHVLTYLPFRGSAAEIEIKNKVLIKRIHWPFKPPTVWKGTTLKNLLLVWPKLMWVAWHECRLYEYDTVHAQGIIAASIALILKRRFKVNVVVTTLALYGFKCEEKGIFARTFKALVSFVLNRCDHLFAEGITGCDDLMRAGVKGGINCFQHWVDTEKLKPKKIESPNLSILFVGRPIPEKGIDIIKNVQKMFKDRKEDLTFMYAENMKYEHLIECYEIADILVVPSLYAEGFVRVVVEAAACGCAIIASDRGALKEMVSPFGRVCEPEPTWFFNCIYTWYHDRGLLKIRQDHAREYAVKNFSPKNAEVMINAY